MGHYPLHFHKRDKGDVDAFSQLYHRQWHGLSRSTLNNLIVAIGAPKQFRMVFNKSWYYFWGQHYCWTATSIFGNYFLAFISFHRRQLSCCQPPLPRCYGVPAVIHMHVTCSQQTISFLETKKCANLNHFTDAIDDANILAWVPQAKRFRANKQTAKIKISVFHTWLTKPGSYVINFFRSHPKIEVR